MTPRSIAYLACRILPLSLFVLNLGSVVPIATRFVYDLVDFVYFGADSATWVGAALIGGVLLLYFLGLWLIWSNAGWLSRKVYPHDDEPVNWPLMRPLDLETTAFSVVGLIFLIWGLTALSRSLLVMTQLFRMLRPDTTWLDWLLTGDIVSALIQIGSGLTLMLGRRGLVRMIRRLRSAGRPDLVEDQADPRETRA
jgi:hypothetical protein